MPSIWFRREFSGRVREKNMKKVLTFGEIMLRLAPPDGHRFLQTNNLEATFGGGEANVAVSLANYGTPVAYLTCLPNNPIGQAAINSLRYFGVDTEKVMRCGDRIGVYYVEKGASQRPSKVVYDRKYSAISMSKPSDYDWDAIFEGISWFHFTGITPALGQNLDEACMEAVKKAKEKGITVSCDLNYRKNLWTSEQACETMSKLMPFVDVCIANEEDAEKVLGIKAKGVDVNSGKLSNDGYREVAEELVKRFHFSYVAITLRTSYSADNNKWAGMLYDGQECCFSKAYDVHIVDRVGGGDSFGGGLIHALISGKGNREAIEFAVAASCLKHSLQGDYNRVTVEEVNALANGSGSGRVER